MDLVDTFHEEILIVQRRMRILRLRSYELLRSKAALLLPHIASRKGIYAKDVAEYLSMETSNVATLLRALSGEGLITLRTPKFDRRYKEIVLTPAGGKFVKEAVYQAGRLAIEGIVPLNRKERDEFAQLSKVIGDALGAPAAVSLSGEEPFVQQQRRLSRFFGMVGSNYMHSGIDIQTYQLLYLLFRSRAPLRFSALAQIAPFERSILSRTLERLTRDGLIVRSKLEKDKRSLLCSLSKEYRKEFAEIHREVTERYREGVKGVPRRTLRRYVEMIKISNEHHASG